MNKRRILIPGWSLGDNAWGVTKPYLHYFSQFGQVEILTPRKDVVNGDLLVLPGGADVNPHRYNQEPSFYTSNTDVFKQYFIDQNLEQYLGKMIFSLPYVGYLIEIIEHCHYRIIGVQYHPEEIYDSFSIKKINELLCVD